MKRQVRLYVFETNSSSVHAIALNKNFEFSCEESKEKFKHAIPEEIHLRVSGGDATNYSKTRYDEKRKKMVKLDDKELVANKIIHIYM